MKCSYNKCIDALTFHHRDPTKKDFNLASGITFSWEKVRQEIDKCDLLCSRCHIETHAEMKEGNNPLVVDGVRPWGIGRDTKPHAQKHCACGAEIYPQTKQCAVCNAKSKEKFTVTAAELALLVDTMPMRDIGAHLGVTDNAVKKRCLKYGIPLKPQGYWLRPENRK